MDDFLAVPEVIQSRSAEATARILGSGVQATVWQFEMDDAFVAYKHFNTGSHFLTVLGEYRALALLHLVLQAEFGSIGEVYSPEPVSFHSTGYVMSRLISSKPLREVLLSGSVEVFHETLAQLLVRALKAYHRAAEAPYGDFHDSNVLVDCENRVALVDPGPTEQDMIGLLRRNSDPMAADVAYWIYTVVTKVTRIGMIRRGAGVWRRISMCRHLLRVAEGSGLDRASYAYHLDAYLGVLATHGTKQLVVSWLGRAVAISTRLR